MGYFTFRDLGKQKPDLSRELITLLSPDDNALEPLPAGAPPVLKPLKGIKTVIFDVYGTIVISGSGDAQQARENGRAGAFGAVMEHFDLFPLSLAEEMEEAFFRLIRESHRKDRAGGIDFPEVDILSIWHRLLEDFNPRFNRPVESPEKLVPRLACCYEGLSNPTSPMPGMADVLAELKSRGFFLGLLSNAQFYTPLLLCHYLGLENLGEVFRPELCVFSYQAGRAKPSPELIRDLLDRGRELGSAAPENFLFVGNDMRQDVFPAAGLGAGTALFAGDRRSLRLREKDPLYSYRKPDIILTELAQLPDLLE